MTFLRQIWLDLAAGRNVTVYIAVLACFLLFFLRLFNLGQPDWPNKLLLATVGLLLVELLRLKTSTESLASSIATLNPWSHFTALDGYPPDLEDTFRRASSVSILTVTCSQTKFIWLDDLTAHLKSGGELRILTVAATPQVFENVLFFGEDGNKTDSMMVNHTNILDSLKNRWEKYLQNGQCDIRALAHVPPYRLVITRDKYGRRTAVWLPRPLAVTGKRFLACRLDEEFHKERIDYLEDQFQQQFRNASRV